MSRAGARRRVLVVLAAVALVVAGCSDDDSEATVAASTTGVPSTTPAPTGTDDDPSTTTTTGAPNVADESPAIEFGWRVVEVVDPTRPTDEVTRGDDVVVGASDTRRIPTVIAYAAATPTEGADPIETEPRPLVVFAHGLGGLTTEDTPMLRALVEAGYVAVGPNFPETTRPAGNGGDFVEQPGDVSAVLDAVLDPTDGVADFLAPLVDADRIGIVGHSLGGSTVYGTVLNDCCIDGRVDAGVSFAGAWGGQYPDGTFTFPDVPLLLIHGDEDAVVPLSQSETVYGEATGPTFFLTLLGIDHPAGLYWPGDRPPASEVAFDATVRFLDTYVAGTSSEPMAALDPPADVAVWEFKNADAPS